MIEPVLRATLLSAAILYLPGALLARRLSRALGGGTIVWLLPCALAVMLAGLQAAALAGRSLGGSVPFLAASALLVNGAALAWRPSAADSRRGVRPAEIAAIGVCVGLLAWTGGALSIHFDALDHVSTIRRALDTHAILPRDEYYKGGDGIGWDPRKGFLPALCALACAWAHVDPLDVWRVWPAVCAPGVVLLIARVCRAWLGAGRASDVALWVWLIVGGGSGITWLSKLGYPNHPGYALAFAALALWVEAMAGARTPPRLVGIALLAAAGEWIHLVPGLLICGGLVIGGAGLVIAERGIGPRVRCTAAAFAAAVLGLALPLGYRAATQGPAVSTLHTHAQNLFELAPGVRTASPFAMLLQVGAVGVWAIALLPAARRAIAPALRAPLVALTIGPWLLVATPVFTLLYQAMGYLVVRFLELVPAVPCVVLGILSAWRDARPRLASRAVSALAVLWIVQSAAASPRVVRQLAHDARGPDTPVASARALAALRDVRAPDGRAPVVLADPFTSYEITATAGAYVVSTLNQHGPPTDSLWARRLVDQREMLYGDASPAARDALLRAYGVDAVYVNTRLPMPVAEFSTQVDSVAVSRAMERFGGDTQRFPVLYRGDDGLIVGVGAPSARATDAVPPAAQAQRTPGESGGALTFGTIRAVRARVTTPVVRRGGKGWLALEWERTGPVGDLPLWVHVRADARVPRRWYIQPAWSKLGRHLAERVDGHLYRFRTDELPLHGIEDLREIRTGDAVSDTLRFDVPANAAPGAYAIKLTVLPEPFAPNLRLRDVLQDDDIWNGPVVGTIQVR